MAEKISLGDRVRVLANGFPLHRDAGFEGKVSAIEFTKNGEKIFLLTLQDGRTTKVRPEQVKKLR